MTQRIKALLRAHWAALGLALTISLLCMGPQAFFRFEHRADGVYGGIELLPDSPWSPRVREILDGHSLGSIYYQDGKDDPYLFQPLGSTIVANIGAPFSLNINDTLLLSRFILPFVAALLIYAFAYLVSGRRYIALSSTGVILLLEPFLNFSGLSGLFSGTGPSNFLDIARPVNPAVIHIFFFGFLTSFWLFYTKRDPRWGVVSALLLGLNFYNYFYAWSYLYAFGGLLGLSLLLRRQWRLAFEVAAVYIGALLVAIPYGLNLYRASGYEVYAQTSERFGVVLTHEPLFWGMTATAAILVFFLGFPRQDKGLYYFGLSLVLTPLITHSQQLITGKILQPGHYLWYSTKPVAVLFCLMVVLYFLSRVGFEKQGRMLAGFLVGVSILGGAYTQAFSYAHGAADGGAVALERQRYGALMDWLNENAQKEDVVLGNDEVSYLTTIYTPLNVFYHRAAIYTLAATPKRLDDVLFTFYRLRGVNAQDAPRVFKEERRVISNNLFGMRYQALSGSSAAIPDDVIDTVALRYAETLEVPAEQWLEDVLEEYKVRFVVWDTKNDSWNLNYSFLREEARIGDFAVYSTRI